MFFKRLTIFSFAVLSISQAAAQLLLPQEEADKHRTNMLVSKINQHVSRIVPRSHRGLPMEQKCQIVFPDANKNQAFSINPNWNPIRIYLPHYFESWAFRANNIIPFVHTYLSARAGSRMPLADTWLSAAIVYDLYEPGMLYGASAFKHYPYARTMAAHGNIPSIQNILNSELADFYEKSSSAARMEWCSLLLKYSARRTGGFEKMLFQNRKLKPADRFEKFFTANVNSQKGKSVFGKHDQSTQDWFSTVCIRTVLGRGIPAAIPYIEESFAEIINTIRPLLIVPEAKKGRKPTLTNETVKALTQAEMKLNFLSLISPEQVALKIYRCADAIRNFRMNVPAQKSIQKIFTEEKAFYAELSERAALEHTLKLAEQRLTTPGMRFSLTLQAIAPEKSDIPLLQKANSLMDRYEKDF
ncbi:MAG: hypothetical protein E7040_00465 [Lentisphaerae bacterium]|nr:hypothetical protein [Lentisphaerota bacterium]